MFSHGYMNNFSENDKFYKKQYMPVFKITSFWKL